LVLVALMAVSYVAGTRWGAPAGADVAGPTAPVVTGQPFEPKQSSGDVDARVGLVEAAWGTGITMNLSGVRGPLTCELLAIDATGRSTVAISWSVPEAGYGTSEQPEPLILFGATAVPRDSIKRLEIRATEPSGYTTTLAVLEN